MHAGWSRQPDAQRVAEVAQPSAAMHDVVAVSRRRWQERHGIVTRVVHRSRPVKAGVAEREHATISTEEPITTALACTGHRHDRCPQPAVAERTVISRVAEGEHTAVAGQDPVAAPTLRSGDAHDRRVEPVPARSPWNGAPPSASTSPFGVRSHIPPAWECATATMPRPCARQSVIGCAPPRRRWCRHAPPPRTVHGAGV